MMDIGNILNTKGSAAAAAAAAAAANPDHQLRQQLAQVTGRSPSESGSERGGSPYGSDPSSRFSSRSAPPLHALANLSNGLRYAPAAMQSSLPMLQTGLIHTNGFENGVIQNGMHASGRPDSGSPTQKAFPCNSCGKGFARRSDLARHG